MKKALFPLLFVAAVAAAQNPPAVRDSLTRWPAPENFWNDFIYKIDNPPRLLGESAAERAAIRLSKKYETKAFITQPDGKRYGLLIGLRSIARPLQDSFFHVRCFLQIRDSLYEFPPTTYDITTDPPSRGGISWFGKFADSVFFIHDWSLPTWFVVEGEKGFVIRRAVYQSDLTLDMSHYLFVPSFHPK